MLLPIIDSLLIQFILDAKPFLLVHQHQDSAEMDRLANQQDDCDNYFEFDYFGAAHFHIRDEADQIEAAFFNVLVPQIDCQT